MIRARIRLPVCLAALGACLILLGASPKVTIDGVALSVGSTQNVRGNTYVSLRSVGRALGADVSYDAKQRRATVTTVLRQLVLQIGNPLAEVNGNRQNLGLPALLVHGEVVLPLRAVTAAFGGTARYDGRTKEIAIVTDSSADAAPSNAHALAQMRTNTLQGTVASVAADQSPPLVQITADGVPYNVSIPEQTRISFRDTHGGLTQEGHLAQVRPGDTLIVTLNSAGSLVSAADIYSGYNGTIASVSGTNMVLNTGRVVIGDARATSVTLNARSASFDQLKSGDVVTVRADPRSGKVRDIVALTPGTIATSATTNPPPGSRSGESLRIQTVDDNDVRALREGQTLRVSAVGTTGARGWFDLGDFIVGNAMREVTPGRYEGEYVAAAGTNIVGTPIIVRLDKADLTAQAQATEPLTIITTPPAIKDTAPDSEMRVNNSRPNIYATFSTAGDTGMDTATLHMDINGRDVTAQATRTGEFIAYYPLSDLPAGRTTVSVRGSDTAGNPVSYRWSFVIVDR
ncbi:MAG: copper amine oxidase N-terminal domain-containing protein [Candidatus Eremiobacteraeota bacterium]|nr:copper amine oxidase N-terminal domain-containing protein [Candidatus Eremiobacteraeota bacterium]